MEKEKKMVSDLERMNKDRRKAEEEYLDDQQRKLEVRRIMRDGIVCVEELLLYTEAVVTDANHYEDLARASNNNIMYSEAVGIKREFRKLLNLLLIDGNVAEHIKENIDGTEEAHRANNKGEEAYA